MRVEKGILNFIKNMEIGGEKSNIIIARVQMSCSGFPASQATHKSKHFSTLPSRLRRRMNVLHVSRLMRGWEIGNHPSCQASKLYWMF